MFTLWELKQKPCLRQCYKTPFYIKNLFLLGLLAACLVAIDFIYFRNENGSVQIAVKILKGLSSSTFNFLEQNKKRLETDDEIVVFGKDSSLHMQTLHFNHVCLGKSKACRFQGLAQDWPAFEKWSDSKKSEEYFGSLFNDRQIDLYRSR